jgi:hypothetical protein
VELHTNLKDFEAHTAECLNSICKVLFSPAPAADGDAEDLYEQRRGRPAVQSGWQLESKSAYWVWLSHPQLGLSLDIKVGDGNFSNGAMMSSLQLCRIRSNTRPRI